MRAAVPRLLPQQRMECAACDNDCAICLHAVTNSFTLGCAHTYCSGCLAKHLERSSCCPLCNEVASASVLTRLLRTASEAGEITDVQATVWSEAVASRAAIAAAAAAAAPPTAEELQARTAADQRSDRDFERFARENHVKQCPDCSVPIIKYGGCNNMTCRACKRQFKWTDAPLVHPCTGVHYKFAPPFAVGCVHWRKQDLPVSANLQVAVCKGACFSVVAVLVFPFAIAAAPFVCAANALKVRKKKQMRLRKLRKLRAAQPYTDPAVLLVARNQLEADRRVANSCRASGDHAWVSDWCSSCGSTRVASCVRLVAESQ